MPLTAARSVCSPFQPRWVRLLEGKGDQRTVLKEYDARASFPAASVKVISTWCSDSLVVSMATEFNQTPENGTL